MTAASPCQPEVPKVTIVVPVYNGANFLAEAINSALAQTYPNIEIIVVNDGSDDHGATDRIARSFGDRIRYVVQPNGGVAAALNLAIREMHGAYFSWLSHDDLYVPDKIAQQMRRMAEQPDAKIIVYSDYAIFSGHPRSAVAVHLQNIPAEQFRWWLMTASALHGCTPLIPRQAFVELGGFNEALRTTQDYDLWFRLAAQYRFIHLPQVLVQARGHAKQGTAQLANLVQQEANTLFAGFVEAFPAAAIVACTGRSLGLGYLRIAETMWRRGYHQAGGCAAARAQQHGVGVLRLKLTYYSAVVYAVVCQQIRHIVSPRVRQLLRGLGS
jgi:glycosyltransferase involved in cell wall biosynthesis